MGRYQNHQHSGRARTQRERDRTQMLFSDWAISDFFEDGEPVRREIPVRFGNARLADACDDSAIAAALPGDTAFDPQDTIDTLDLGLLWDEAPDADDFADLDLTQDRRKRWPAADMSSRSAIGTPAAAPNSPDAAAVEDAVTEDDNAVPEPAVAAEKSIPVLRPPRFCVTETDETAPAPFALGRLLRGFAVGAGAALLLILLARTVM